MNSNHTDKEGRVPSDITNSGDEVLDSLFSHASARKRPPEDVERATRKALHSEWQLMTRVRSRKRKFAFGLAASVLMAAIIGVTQLGQSPSPLPGIKLATVEKQSGNIFVRLQSGQASDAHRLDSNELTAGQVLITDENARLALAWANGESIRLDEETKLILNSSKELELVKGRIYIDSRQTGGVGAFEIKTLSGSVRHLGTQYMAGLNNDSLQVSVREGKVLIESGSNEITALPGQKVLVDDSGETRVEKAITYGADWEWTGLVTPEFELDGLSAYQFINWAARESGRSVSFASYELELLAKKTVLRGSIDLEPIRALSLILQTSDLEPVVVGGEIQIRKRPES